MKSVTDTYIKVNCLHYTPWSAALPHTLREYGMFCVPDCFFFPNPGQIVDLLNPPPPENIKLKVSITYKKCQYFKYMDQI